MAAGEQGSTVNAGPNFRPNVDGDGDSAAGPPRHRHDIGVDIHCAGAEDIAIVTQQIAAMQPDIAPIVGSPLCTHTSALAEPPTAASRSTEPA